MDGDGQPDQAELRAAGVLPVGEKESDLSAPECFAYMNGCPSSAAEADEMEAWPEAAVLALAAYCEQACVPEGEVFLHVLPFGGVPQSVDMLARLRRGDWPPISIVK